MFFFPASTCQSVSQSVTESYVFYQLIVVVLYSTHICVEKINYYLYTVVYNNSCAGSEDVTGLLNSNTFKSERLKKKFQLVFKVLTILVYLMTLSHF
jgi:hypothetical protein